MKRVDEKNRNASIEERAAALEIPGSAELRYFSIIDQEQFAQFYDAKTKSINIDPKSPKRFFVEQVVGNHVPDLDDAGFISMNTQSGRITVIDNGSIYIRGRIQDALIHTVKAAGLRSNQLVITGLIKSEEYHGSISDWDQGAWLEGKAPVDEIFTAPVKN